MVGEYTSIEFKTYLLQHGITHHISCPYTPQQNGLVERKRRHFTETTVTLLSQAKIPSSYWSYDVLTEEPPNSVSGNSDETKL